VVRAAESVLGFADALQEEAREEPDRAEEREAQQPVVVRERGGEERRERDRDGLDREDARSAAGARTDGRARRARRSTAHEGERDRIHREEENRRPDQQTREAGLRAPEWTSASPRASEGRGPGDRGGDGAVRGGQGHPPVPSGPLVRPQDRSRRGGRDTGEHRRREGERERGRHEVAELERGRARPFIAKDRR
jgi:hypothetical protein